MPKIVTPRRRDVEAAIVARLHDEMDHRDWNIASLLAALERAGYPMQRTPLKRLLDGERSMTVDDAAGLAAAFGIDVASLVEPPTARNNNLFARELLLGVSAEKACEDAVARLREAQEALERAELARMRAVMGTAAFLADTSPGVEGATNGELRQAYLRRGATKLGLPVSEHLRAFVGRVLEEYEEYEDGGMDLNQLWMNRNRSNPLDPFGQFRAYEATEEEHGR
ncbi:hypothetical protein [Rathayibacter sp. AY1E2]|uniref:hypothetical protein n=1 Tax=Rathayibacter sp. AY1E2 TaxID=2080550 RepID=UPI000CE7806B|nr:hypothetical protein [Rathayibacter sp. AY1E2]PPH50201.1 hypothetical protein C5C49_15305 [Rathayibacter sp. AY1E2]